MMKDLGKALKSKPDRTRYDRCDLKKFQMFISLFAFN
jgi:hypothetical protein